jgi:hypothetical protein
MSHGTGSNDCRSPGARVGLVAFSEPSAAREPGLFGEVTVQIQHEAVPPLVVVTGRLGSEGGALLDAMLGHVRRQHGPGFVLDLRRVSYADLLGLAPVLAAGAVIRNASPVVRQALRAWAGDDGRAGRGPTAAAPYRQSSLVS